MSPGAVRNSTSDRVFYSAVPVAAAAAIFYGFSTSWFLRPFLPPAPHPVLLTPLIALHGVVFSTWLILTVVQPLLIGARYYRLHRRLGYAGAGLAALMVVLMLVTAFVSMRAGDIGNFNASGLFLAVNVALAAEFAVIMWLAVSYRSRPEAHKRLVLLSFVALLPPALSRWPTVIGPPIFTCDLIIVVGMIYDAVVCKRVHPVWIWSLPAMLFAGVLTAFIGFQPATQDIANLIVALRL